jgi:hypothetical protein
MHFIIIIINVKIKSHLIWCIIHLVILHPFLGLSENHKGLKLIVGQFSEYHGIKLKEDYPIEG